MNLQNLMLSEKNQGHDYTYYDIMYETFGNMQNKIVDCLGINTYAIVLKHAQDWQITKI